MLLDRIYEGVSRAATDIDAETAKRIAKALAADAVALPHSRDVLALDRNDDEVIHYNLFKAMTAAAGVLGAALGIATPLTLAAVLSAIGALGALQGLRERLPQASALIAALLYADTDKSMSREALRSAFEVKYDGLASEVQRDFEKGLEALERVGSVRIERGTVRLVELIVVRL